MRYQRVFPFVAGFCLGGSVFCVLAVIMVLYADRWLVVNQDPVKADLIVVLGGGGAGRLRQGLSLFDQGFAKQVLLVDESVNDWTQITNYLCKDCIITGKNVVILTGSTSTFTDASLVKAYCLAHHIKSFLVVTDPFHTRRVWLTFLNEFKQSPILFTVISSGDKQFLPPPGKPWWTDQATLESVWVEMIKCVYVILQGFNDVIVPTPVRENR
jgi:uncharacterized SAM-binding protein YcdF (DUF218 family)